MWLSVMVSPTEAKTFEVSREFFWRYQLGQHPIGVRSLGIASYSVRQLNEGEVRNSAYSTKGSNDEP